MNVNGRNHPVASVTPMEDGGALVRVDFELDLAAWVEIKLSSDDLRDLLVGSIQAKRTTDVVACEPDSLAAEGTN